VEAGVADFRDYRRRRGTVLMAASNKDELLHAMRVHGGVCEPYGMVSGGVRGVAVDRWLNELLAAGEIEYISQSRARAIKRKSRSGGTKD